MSYCYVGSFRTRYGHRDKVVEILLSGIAGLRAAGCELYVVAVSDTDADVIWVTEVWPSKEAHDASLRLPEAQAAVARALPLLTGEFTRQELTVVGGVGVGEC